MPPHEEDTPPGQDTPPQEDTPPEEHRPPLRDPPLVTLLTQLFALGYSEQMAGREVKDDDLILAVDAQEIESLAGDCIAHAEAFIHEQYMENPQMVHDGMYAAGRWAYSEQERQYLQW